MSLDDIRARANAYEDRGTPGRNAPKDRKVLLAGLDAVLALHWEVGTKAYPTCHLDGYRYPCPTVKAITEAAR